MSGRNCGRDINTHYVTTHNKRLVFFFNTLYCALFTSVTGFFFFFLFFLCLLSVHGFLPCTGNSHVHLAVCPKKEVELTEFYLLPESDLGTKKESQSNVYIC